MNKPAFLAELPSDWTSVSTEDLLIDRKGAIKIGPFGSQLKKEYFVSDGYKVYGQENVFENDFAVGDRRINKTRYLQLFTCQLMPGDVVISMMGTVGKCTVAPPDIDVGIMDSHLLRLQVDEKRYDKGLLVQLISDSEIVKSQIKSLAVGGIMEGLSSTIIKRLEFPRPPLPEQRKIAKVLSTVDNLIEKTQTLIDKYQSIKLGMMHDLFTRGVDENGQLRPSYAEAPHLYKESELGWIPQVWDLEAIGKLSIGGLKNGYFKKPELVGSGYKLINVSELYQSFGVDTRLESVERVEADDKDFDKYKALEGDIFFTRSSLVLSGIAWCNIIRNLHEPTLYECHVMRIRPNKDLVVPDYLALFCKGHAARNYLMARAKQVTMTTIAQPDIIGMPVPVPSLTEQAMISTRVLKVDQKMSTETAYLLKLQGIKRGLMQDLLTGRVRVAA